MFEGVNPAGFVFFVLAILWMGGLTFTLFRMRAHYNSLTSGISRRGLEEILEEILKRGQGVTHRIDRLEEAVKLLGEESALHISRVGLVRFNPFSDTGGSQSFTLALLDGKDNGLVMTSLYARTGNRWYVKEIYNGKGRGIELSKEEMSAIQRAKPLKELNA